MQAKWDSYLVGDIWLEQTDSNRASHRRYPAVLIVNKDNSQTNLTR